MIGLPGWFERLALSDRLLAGAAVVVGALLLLAALFAVVTILLRLHHVARRRATVQLEAAWEPLILDALAGDDIGDRVHRLVPPKERRFFAAYLLRYVERFSGEGLALIRRLARPALPHVAEELTSRRPEVRARAIQSLVLLGVDDYDDRIVAALDDPSTTVAMVAARALASPEKVRFAGHVLRRLPRFRDWSGSYLSSMLAGMGSEVAPELRVLYVDESRDVVDRRIAADALHDLDDIESAAFAERIARGAADVELRAASLRLLGRVGQREQAAVARAALDSDEPLIRLRAAEALAGLGSDRDADRLRLALDDPSIWVAIAAARALHSSGAFAALRSFAAADGPRADLAREFLESGEAA